MLKPIKTNRNSGIHLRTLRALFSSGAGDTYLGSCGNEDPFRKMTICPKLLEKYLNVSRIILACLSRIKNEGLKDTA